MSKFGGAELVLDFLDFHVFYLKYIDNHFDVKKKYVYKEREVHMQ